MNIRLINQCRYRIVLCMDDGGPVFLQPFETRDITRSDSDVLRISAKRDWPSTLEASVYHLVVETDYHFSNVRDGATFTIIREKIRFALNASYDRVFLLPARAYLLSETYRIVGEEEMKKAFRHSRRGDFIFESILNALGLLIVLGIAGLSLTLIWGWRIAVIYFPLAFLLIFALNLFASKFSNTVFRRLFQVKDEETEFERYFECDFIENYYSDPERTPFTGNVEIN